MKIIEFPTFTTNGKSAKELIDDLNKKGLKVSNYVGSLADKGLIATTKGEEIKLVGIRGSDIGSGNISMNDVIRFSRKYKWQDAKLEDALYLRLLLTNEDLEKMGLWYITIMHPLFPDTDEGELCLRRSGKNNGDLVESHPEEKEFPAESQNAYVWRVS